jgi:hypothetical protein
MLEFGFLLHEYSGVLEALHDIGMVFSFGMDHSAAIC